MFFTQQLLIAMTVVAFLKPTQYHDYVPPQAQTLFPFGFSAIYSNQTCFYSLAALLLYQLDRTCGAVWIPVFSGIHTHMING